MFASASITSPSGCSCRPQGGAPTSTSTIYTFSFAFTIAFTIAAMIVFEFFLLPVVCPVVLPIVFPVVPIVIFGLGTIHVHSLSTTVLRRLPRVRCRSCGSCDPSLIWPWPRPCPDLQQVNAFWLWSGTRPGTYPWNPCSLLPSSSGCHILCVWPVGQYVPIQGCDDITKSQ